MISLEAWTTIRHLHAQGHSIRRIARDLHLSRQAVRRAIASTEPPRYHRRPEEQPQLVPFLPLMQQMAEERLIGSRVLTEIRARGYQGSAATFYRAWARLRPTQPDPRVTERFETPPGVQSQFDWPGYTVLLGSALTRVVVYGLILSYSRRLHYWASLDATQASIFEALEAGFWHFGGATKTLLVDNPRAFMLDARPASFQWNPHFLALCGHYRVEPRVCQPARPQTKGKIERPFFYLEEHFIKGTSWHVLPSRCWMSASTTRPIRHLWRDSLRRRRTLCRCRRRAT